MNNGILFAFYLISFLIGTAAMGVCFLLYIENKKKFIKYYTSILLVEFFNNVLTLFLLFYKVENGVYFDAIAGISSFFEFLILGFLISSITGVKFGKLKISLISIVLFIASLSLVADRLFVNNSLYSIVKNINFLFYIVVLYYLFLTIKSMFTEKNRDIILILNIILLSFVFAIPLALIRELFFKNLYYLNHSEDSIVYLILNIGGFILFFRKISLKLEIKRETENNETITYPLIDSLKDTNEKKDDIKKVYINDSSKFSLTDFALTQREYQITELIMEGFSNQDIADKLFISIKTVKTHIYNVYQKLDVRNRTELMFKFKK